MSQLNAVPADQESPPGRKFVSRVSTGMIAACLAVVACLAGSYFIRTKRQSISPAVPVANVQVAPTQSAPAKPETELQPALELAQGEVAKLKEQLSAAEDRTRQTSLSAANIEQQLKEEREERKEISQEKTALSQQLIAAQTEAQSLRDKSAMAGGTTTQLTARTVALEAKVHDLNVALDEKDRMLALDKEFLAHDREIRDLIGARNLYIADIYDVAQSGKTAKPFGRIFYTKDRSLVFYGYDLDKQAGLKQSVAFQAWGSGDDKQNVSLGLFYQDETHKRWVLRFNDTKTLARLNMVFVTAEPQGGSTKPTGKPLLLAYLQMQPNHP
jgi:hypothetical protein